MPEPSVQRLLGYSADLAGAAVGFTAEYLQAVQSGVGGPIASGVAALLKELAARQLSPRECTRIAAATDVATDRISTRLIAGHLRRSDSFFDDVQPGRSPSQELLEAVLLKARDSFEEKKVRYIGLFYANLVFSDYVSPQSAHYLLKELERLTYRQLCLLALVGAKEQLDVEALRRPEHGNPELEALKREEMDLHSTDLGTKGLIVGAGPWTDQLSVLGKALYDLAGLSEIPDGDKGALDAMIQSLRPPA